MDRAMITDVDAFFISGCGRCNRFNTTDCSARIWGDGLAALRDLCLSVGLTETAKWGHPCYMHAGRNIAMIGAARSNFQLSFFNAALMKDPHGVLEKQGQNTKTPDILRFSSADTAHAQAGLITAYLAEAMGYAEAGILPLKVVQALDLPAELIEVLDADPDMAEAFHAMTPGRQKSWVIHLNSTQVPATRIARIAKGRAKMLAGKGALER